MRVNQNVPGSIDRRSTEGCVGISRSSCCVDVSEWSFAPDTSPGCAACDVASAMSAKNFFPVFLLLTLSGDDFVSTFGCCMLGLGMFCFVSVLTSASRARTATPSFFSRSQKWFPLSQLLQLDPQTRLRLACLQSFQNRIAYRLPSFQKKKKKKSQFGLLPTNTESTAKIILHIRTANTIC